MGYELRRATRDALPPDLLTPTERIVLLELADLANDKTRLAYPGMDTLARVTGLPRKTVSACLRRLAIKGLELRVPVDKAKDGRVVVASRGHQTTYRIPELPRVSSTEKGPTTVGSLAEKGPTTVAERAYTGSRKGLPVSAPSPHRTLKEPSSLPQPSDVRSLIAAAGASTDEEIDQTIKTIKNHNTVRHITGWVRAAAANGTLTDWVQRARTGQAAAKEAEANERHTAHYRAMKTRSECEHGYPGGHEVEPVLQWATCPIYRTAHLNGSAPPSAARKVLDRSDEWWR